MTRHAVLLALCLTWGCDDGGDPPREVVQPEAGLPDAAPDGAVVDAAPSPPDGAPPDVDAVVPPDAAPDAKPDAALTPECGNQIDDDDDGLIDFPLDPGCADLADPEEVDPDEPACRNGQDDDADGNIDHPADPGCFGPDDPSEASACGEHVVRDISALRRVEGTTVGAPSIFPTTCRNNMAPEAVFRFTLRDTVQTLHFDTEGTRFDTLLSVRPICDALEPEFACNDDATPAVRTSAVDLDRPTLGDYFVVLDGFLEGQGDYVLNVRASVADGAPCPEGDGPVQCRFGATCRDGVCAPAACADREDNDRDGRTDYPDDPGCDAVDDDDETSPDPLPQCADGIDNNGDGNVDFPDDPFCRDAADPEESRPPQCRDGQDNDRDGLIDLDDPGCMNDPNWFSEFNIEACRDGEDNDEDGLIDYPADPGCSTTTDPDEVDPDPLPQCSNGVDDDADGLVDFPEDIASCIFAADDTEDDPCLRTEPVEITGLADVRGNSAERPNDFGASCQANTGNENVLLWRVAEGRTLEGMVLNTRNSDFDTVVSVRDRCDAPLEEELGCDDDGGAFGASFLTLGPQAPGTDLWIFIDGGFANSRGIWRLSVTPLLAEGANCGAPGTWTCADGFACVDTADGARCRRAACANGEDDDEDGLTDFPADPGCDSGSDGDEEDPIIAPVCANGLDDDEDGLIDYPDDPQCPFAADPFEGPDCADGIDNDGDGLIDYDRDGDGFRDRNGDNGCACANDPTEDRQPQCQDGCDNDRDGLIDAADPGCFDDPGRDNEFNVAQCRDGLDNNGDGLADFPVDPGCLTRDDPLEDDQDPLPQCADGVDNDEDGAIDYAGLDDGCTSAADDDERSACAAEQPPFPVEGFAEGSTRDATHDHEGTCRPGGQAPDVTWRADVPYRARVTVSSAQSTFDTVLYARTTCAPLTECPEAPPAPDAGLDDAGRSDAGAPDGAVPDAGAPCMPESTEIACNDDFRGVQSLVEFDWDGGPFFVFLDGFGNQAGDYRVSVEAVYPRGGQCGPVDVPYARCPMGFECRPDEAAGAPTCQAQ